MAGQNSRLEDRPENYRNEAKKIMKEELSYRVRRRKEYLLRIL